MDNSRTYYYARVSTKEQNLDRQIIAFKKLDFKYIAVNELMFSKLPDNIKDSLSFIKENADYIIRIQAKDYDVLQNTIRSIGRSKARQ